MVKYTYLWSPAPSSGGGTPPLHVSAAVPFAWEETPGIPRPIAAVSPLARITVAAAAYLKLPPRLAAEMRMSPWRKEQRSRQSEKKKGGDGGGGLVDVCCGGAWCKAMKIYAILPFSDVNSTSSNSSCGSSRTRSRNRRVEKGRRRNSGFRLLGC